MGELPAGTNWNFDVHWYSKIPGLIAASSFEGNIGIYNIEVIFLSNKARLLMHVFCNAVTNIV